MLPLAGWIVLGTLCLAAIILVVAAALRVLMERKNVAQTAAQLRVRLRTLSIDGNRLEPTIARLDDDAAALNELLARVQRAVQRIREALEELRLPEATAAICTAVAALRAIIPADSQARS
jgi:chromosome segregation ATPase